MLCICSCQTTRHESPPPLPQQPPQQSPPPPPQAPPPPPELLSVRPRAYRLRKLLSAVEARELIELTCLECHNGPRAEGGVDLGAALEDPGRAAEALTRAVRRVEAGEMPPEAPLDHDEQKLLRSGVMAWLGVAPGDPGRPTLRRLRSSNDADHTEESSPNRFFAESEDVKALVIEKASSAAAGT